MRIKKTIPINIGNLIEYYPDDFTSHLISKSDTYYMNTFESDSLAGIHRFSIPTDISEHFKGCIDNDCIYLPTKLGQILAIDKFSGKLLTSLNTSLPIMSDLKCDERFIYCVCGVPISRKWNISVDNYCVLVFDKQTGTKLAQTSYFRGYPSFLNPIEGIFYLTYGSYLLSFFREGELIIKINIGASIDFCPILSENTILLANKDGSIRIISEEDFSFLSIIKGEPNEFGPLFSNKQLVWITDKGVYHSDPPNKKAQIIESNRKLQHPASFDAENVWSSDFQGGVVRINTETKEIRSLKLGLEPIKYLNQVENSIFVATQNNLFLIET